MCHGCTYNISRFVDKPMEFKKHLKRVGRRRVRGSTSGHYEYTAKSLVRTMYRLLYLIKDGPRPFAVFTTAPASWSIIFLAFAIKFFLERFL